jgi:uncharacterized protein (DUF1810 family)
MSLSGPGTGKYDPTEWPIIDEGRIQDMLSNDEKHGGGQDGTGADDPFDLKRFVDAQNAGSTYDRAVEELQRGAKTSHWMWFVFPQIAGLGQSPTARRYAISTLDEAKAYLQHPVLGARFRECARILAQTDGRSAAQIFGMIDAVKLRSSMTLFLRASPDDTLFQQVLDRYYEGQADPATDQRL